jgi:phosphatidylglycerophosphatase A
VLILSISTGLGSGYSPFAPGTAGTALAVLLFLPFAAFCSTRGGFGLGVYVAGTMMLTAVGVWAATRAEPIFGKKDAGQVVIDEIAGYLVTMFALPATWPWALAGFAVFRLFDIWKPWPIDGLQRLKGGWGVMIDDLVAGIYGCALLHILAFFIA